MRFDDHFALEHADARAAFLRRLERSKERVPQKFRGHAGAVVADGQYRPAVLFGGLNADAAVLADGSGKIAWETKDRVYVPSLLVRDGYLYGVLDAGVAACWKCDSGEEVWKQRLGGTFSASPVLVGDRLYATNEAGETFVYLANPEKYTQLGLSKLGDEALASQAICGGRIYARVAERIEGRRQEMLYCLGQAKGK